jgi:hypothetical protein
MFGNLLIYKLKWGTKLPQGAGLELTQARAWSCRGILGKSSKIRVLGIQLTRNRSNPSIDNGAPDSVWISEDYHTPI